PVSNFLCEALATFVLVLTVLYAANASLALGDQTAKIGLGALGAIPVGLIVFGIGLSLGGTTGYAINPARDFSPRLAHALLPIPGKGGSDWGYAWIPVAGPMAGGALAAGIYLLTGASAPAVG
ncbi:MAG TPA: aquaporin, partial [Planctomycetota bacterium]|nr:aquaporin [Planctomycetota bacterium]